LYGLSSLFYFIFEIISVLYPVALPLDCISSYNLMYGIHGSLQTCTTRLACKWPWHDEVPDLGNLSMTMFWHDRNNCFLQVMYDKYSGRSRRFGFVTMSTVEEANAATEALNETVSFKCSHLVIPNPGSEHAYWCSRCMDNLCLCLMFVPGGWR
jgi:RNA recognition motif-containing protein